MGYDVRTEIRHHRDLGDPVLSGRGAINLVRYVFSPYCDEHCELGRELHDDLNIR